MNVIVCVGNDNALLFNNRRVSKDKKIFEDIKKVTSVICCDYHSRNLLESEGFDTFIKTPKKGDYFFLEKGELPEGADKVIIYCFNRDYPFDVKFNFDCSRFRLVEYREFKGNSHDKIIKEVYEVLK